MGEPKAEALKTRNLQHIAGKSKWKAQMRTATYENNDERMKKKTH